jgi:hypothetical protein
MGSNEDIMHDFVRKELKRLYPGVDGWQIRKSSHAGKDAGFIVSRRLLGRFEGAHVLVSFDYKVAPGTVDSLKAMARAEPIPGTANSRLILMVPQGADTSMVPGGIDVLFLQSFGFEGKELVWLKRRSQVSEKTAKTS